MKSLSDLQRTLERELKQQKGIRIIRSSSWGLPVDKIHVVYTTVKRTTMDILMKMILLTAEKLDVSSPAAVADFLAVDPLFTENLCNKMLRADMIKKEQDGFSLTAAGRRHLEEGTFEHPPETDEKIFIYSSCHQAILCEDEGEAFAGSSKRFRLAPQDEENKLEIKAVRSALEQSQAECPEYVLQTVIDQIENPVFMEENLTECFEFYLYNEEENIYFTRVWNPLTGQWDEQLEKMIDEKDPLQTK